MNSTDMGMPSDNGGMMQPFLPPNLFAKKEPTPFNMERSSTPSRPQINQAIEPVTKQPVAPSFDVDELVKKIDAKIAELEKEEALNKEKEEMNRKKEKEEKLEESPSKEVNTSINLNLDDNDNDDDFFDDFFDE